MSAVRITWARSATRHGIGKARSGHVIEHAGLAYRVSAPEGRPDDRLVFLGDDTDGFALEVMAIEREHGGIHVIHAMPMRPKYQERYEEAKRWRV